MSDYQTRINHPGGLGKDASVIVSSDDQATNQISNPAADLSHQLKGLEDKGRTVCSVYVWPIVV